MTCIDRSRAAGVDTNLGKSYNLVERDQSWGISIGSLREKLLEEQFMMVDIETIDVRGHLQLPANIHFREQAREVQAITLLDSATLRLSLVDSGASEDVRTSLLETFRENEGNHKAVIEEIERTLIVP